MKNHNSGNETFPGGQVGIFQNCKQNKLRFMKAKDGIFVKENKDGRKRGETVEGTGCQ